ncbi:MAG TPA: SRPBCC domain-containing protein [Actinomycetota bacterium]|nr:SRPBCC domain-containing protein [Actinomycetota bacterium]
MSVTDVRKDPTTLSMVVTAEFAAPVERVWQMWDDPRRLERWWGPPTHPATFVEHDLKPDGRVTYFMTGPDGERYHGWWRVLVVDAPHTLEFEDGFGDENGQPKEDLPVTRSRVRLEPVDAGTRMTIESLFPTLEAMEQILAMGAEEGLVAALSQIDEQLAA